MEVRLGLLFLAHIIVPLGCLIWLWRVSDNKLHWLLKSIVTSTLVIELYFTGSWPWFFYSLRYVYLALLVIIILKSAWQTRTLPDWPKSNLKVWLTYAVMTSPSIIFLIYIIQAIDGHSYQGGAVELSFPLRNGVYYIHHGGSSVITNHHNPSKAQRYALDVLKLNSFGRRSSGIYPTELTEYEIFAEPLLSPCDGIIVSAENTDVDLIPPKTDREHPAGNHVMIECKGVEVLLAHMMQGSVVVKPGDFVKTGQPIGKVGNSGNTSEPHLHIHARRDGSGENLLDGTGVPMLFSGRYLVRNSLVRAP